ncbi:MAG: amidase [Metallosphaera sp.]|nr:amidase [Metallosphaera cuprina]
MSLEKLNSVYNAFITTFEKKGGDGPLAGLTFGVKDVIETEGIKTTAGSRILRNNVPKRDAWIVKAILSAGGTILGKTNTHEFAIGATNTSSLVGPARNPRDKERISGGSSGGSAVAVALNMVDVGVGTDTGGSIRIPASLCGVIGYKPSYGVFPTEGVIPFSWSLDTIGFLTRDLETLWMTIKGILPASKVKYFLQYVRSSPRVGLFMFDETTKDVLEKVLEFFPNSKEVNLRLMTKYGSQVRRIIAGSEGASYHTTWLKTMRDMYFPDVLKVLDSGQKTSAVDYINSLRMRKLILEEYVRTFNDFDVIISPTTKITAPKISEVLGKEAEFRDGLVSITELFNLVGAPSISVPIMERQGLPIGIMISGKPFSDGVVLGLAKHMLPN